MNLSGSLILLTTALIWGLAFVAQRVGMDYVGPFTFSCVRYILGGAVLLPLILLRRQTGRVHDPLGETDDHPTDTEQSARRAGNPSAAESQTIHTQAEAGSSPARPAGTGAPSYRRRLLTGGVLCGIALGVASCLQQAGILYSTVAKSGFITALYIVLVPVAGFLFLKKRVSARLWVAVAAAAVGLYLLSMGGGSLRPSAGDTILALCALCFTAQILLVDHYSVLADCIELACLEFFTAALTAAIPMVLFETPTAAALRAAALPLLYAGIFSSGIAYTLQIVGQKNLNPSVASLIMSLESPIAAVAAYFLLGQTLTLRELAGCLIMGAAIILAQL